MDNRITSEQLRERADQLQQLADDFFDQARTQEDSGLSLMYERKAEQLEEIAASLRDQAEQMDGGR